jgi:hypothetical protein
MSWRDVGVKLAVLKKALRPLVSHSCRKYVGTGMFEKKLKIFIGILDVFTVRATL